MKYFLNRQFILFILIGGFNTLLAYGVYLGSLYILSISYVYALVAEYIFGTINSYVWNRYLTFHSRTTHRRAFSKFVLVYIIVFGLNYVLLYICVDILMYRAGISQFFILAFIAPVSFFSHKYWS